MNIKALRVFSGVVQTGSLSEAAERLNTSASAASRLLALLEAELGLALFSRQHRRLELTRQGQEFYRRTMHILKGIDEIRDIARDIGGRRVEPLRLVSTVTVARAIIAPALADWKAANPHSTAYLDIETRFEMESRIAAREFNLGVASLPQENAIIDLTITPLMSARYEVALPPGHPLAAEAAVPVEALSDVPMVALRAGQRWRTRMDAVCTVAGLRPRIVVETGSTVIAAELVRRGAGAFIVDRVCSALVPDGLVLRPLTPETWTDYAALTGPGGPSALTGDFIDTLRRRVQAGRAACADLAASVALS